MDPVPDRHSEPGLVEVGWVLAGRLEEADARAAREARERVLRFLEAELPRFRWTMPLVKRPDLASSGAVAQMRLYDEGLAELTGHHWDFVLVVTQYELESYRAPFAHASVSRALAAAVVSTSRVDPVAEGGDPGDPARGEALAARVAALVLHALGHLFGLAHVPAPENLMYAPEDVEDLDRMRALDAGQRELMAQSLARVSDRRLEEEAGEPQVPLRFYLRAGWINRRELARGVLDAKAWLLPFRLSGLTIAALSTMIVLMMTAEAWDLGISQGPARVVAGSAAAMLLTSGYLLWRQKLLVLGRRRRLSEQVATTNLTAVGIVLVGALTTWLLLFLMTLSLGALLFRRELVASWAASLERAPEPTDYAVFSAFVSAVGILIGALGTSFEGKTRFRHAACVDEEI